jgi:hypothetical protein
MDTLREVVVEGWQSIPLGARVAALVLVVFCVFMVWNAQFKTGIYGNPKALRLQRAGNILEQAQQWLSRGDAKTAAALVDAAKSMGAEADLEKETGINVEEFSRHVQQALLQPAQAAKPEQ